MSWIKKGVNMLGVNMLFLQILKALFHWFFFFFLGGQNLYQKENMLYFRVIILRFLFKTFYFYEQSISLGGIILLLWGEILKHTFKKKKKVTWIRRVKCYYDKIYCLIQYGFNPAGYSLQWITQTYCTVLKHKG